MITSTVDRQTGKVAMTLPIELRVDLATIRSRSMLVKPMVKRVMTQLRSTEVVLLVQAEMLRRCEPMVAPETTRLMREDQQVSTSSPVVAAMTFFTETVKAPSTLAQALTPYT